LATVYAVVSVYDATVTVSRVQRKVSGADLTMPKISESQATKLLEDNCGAPRGTMQGNRGQSQINRSKHRRLAMAVAGRSVKLMDLSERWSAGTPTEAELKAAISAQIRMQFGVITWLIWAWRIYSWVSVIWDAWNREQE
jgi:hypothetical protein